MEVLKTTSPKRVPGATASPSKTPPSSRTRIPVGWEAPGAIADKSAARRRGGLVRDLAPDNRRQGPHLVHQLVELVRQDGLAAVRQRLLRLVVDLDHQAVRPHR